MIKKKKNGKYVVNVIDEYGNRVQRTFSRKTDAAAFESSIVKSKYEKKLVASNLMQARFSIAKAIEEYLLSKSNLKPRSKQKYALVMRLLSEYTVLKQINYLDEFRPENADQIYHILIVEREVIKGDKKKVVKAKPKTVNFYLTALREFFKLQMLKDRINKNPFLHIKNLKVERALPEYYSKDELKRFFLQEMKTEYHNAFKGLLLTGMRFEEMANLVCANVDLEKRLIYVRNNADFTTKTENAIRAIPMSEELFGLVSALIRNKSPNDYVFNSVEGAKLRERKLLEVCKKIALKAGITSRAYLHKFRHTFATMLVQADVPLETIRDLLGHSSIVETEIYAHNKTEHRHHQVQILDDLLK